MDEIAFTSSLIGIEVIFSLMVLAALRSAGLRMGQLSVLGVVLAGWLAAVCMLLLNGFFSATGRPQLAFVLGIVIPVVTGLLAARLWRPLREAMDALPTTSFLRLQTMRAGFGLMFFFTAALPPWFQYVGGLGDIAAGAGAFLALRHLRGHPGEERSAIIRGNVIGILDFVVVLNLGAFVVLQDRSTDIMFELIPLYAVPIFILLHVFSLRRLRTESSNHYRRLTPCR